MQKPELADVFYFALSNCLVADNLQIAKSAAFGGNQRHRVVTLEGAVIETSGAMTGGGKPR
jgi:structural maintenance of chromosome 4